MGKLSHSDYKSLFATSKDGLQTLIRYGVTDEIVGVIQYVADPDWPHFEILDWTGITVQVEIEEPKAFKVITEIVNRWLKEGPYATGEGSSDPLEEIPLDRPKLDGPDDGIDF